VRDTFARTLYQVTKETPKVFIVVADISPAGSMAQFREEFPDRFINVGVAEQSMIGLCAGLAMRGCRAFAYTIATFTIYRPFEHVRDDLCYQNLPVTLVGIGGGVTYSVLGGTHHAQEDVAVMGAIPNMAIIAPCDPAETEAATWACARRDGPTYLRLGKAGEPILSAKAASPFEFGRIRFLKEGKDTCILTYGPITKMAFDVAAGLEQADGRSVAIVSVHTLKPLDVDGLASVLVGFDQVLVIEEHSERGGLAAQVKQLAWERRATCELQTFSLKDEFIHVFGSHGDILAAHGLTVPSIVAAVRRPIPADAQPKWPGTEAGSLKAL
jgi:transketolase